MEKDDPPSKNEIVRGPTQALAGRSSSLVSRGLRDLTRGLLWEAEFDDRQLMLFDCFPEYWREEGLRLHELGKYEEALAAFDRALAIDPHYIDALYDKASTLNYLWRYEQALAALDQILAHLPKLASAWQDKGLILYQTLRYEEALAAFDRALAIDPIAGITWQYKGLTLHMLGRLEEEQAAYDRSRRLPQGQALSGSHEARVATPTMEVIEDGKRFERRVEEGRSRWRQKATPPTTKPGN